MGKKCAFSSKKCLYMLAFYIGVFPEAHNGVLLHYNDKVLIL